MEQGLSPNLNENNEIETSLLTADTRLNELCQSKHIGPPQFTYESDPNFPCHAPIFRVICKVLEHETTGYGHTKKRAKKQASLNMISVLENLHLETVKNARLKRKRKHPGNSPLDSTSALHSMSLHEGADVRCEYEVIGRPVIRCTMNTKYGIAIGEGRNKKEAKKDASSKIFGNVEDGHETTQENGENLEMNDLTQENGEKLEMNDLTQENGEKLEMNDLTQENKENSEIKDLIQEILKSAEAY